MNEIRIRDLYAGKPDAKDEFNFEGSEKFIETFVVADHFNLDLLIKGSHCFITGFKGTGKTALLFYLEDLVKTIDEASCTSYIFFKENFTDIKRNELTNLSQRVMSSISVENGALIDTTEFEYIWRWILYKQIVTDNQSFSRNLFVDNDKWQSFEKLVNQIIEPTNKRKFSIPNKIRLALPYIDPASQAEIKPEVEVDFQNMQSDSYNKFVSLVDEAEIALSQVTRTDIPYYLFIDELEAYYGEIQIFKRDLCMIRDLIFSVKRFNAIFASSGMDNTKIICSIRSEIINAISRFIVSKEINKVIAGFSVPLTWNYANNNSYAHPIIQILLKRIAVCEGSSVDDFLDTYRRWFPEKIHDSEAASYILNNSWYKPRDMIRLLICAQNCMFNDTNKFTTNVFDSFSKMYSEDSLGEIREELRALYAPEDIDNIISCFTGFKTVFSIADLEDRIKRFFKDTILDSKLVPILNDLYRLGFVGNYLPESKTYHWQHRGDNALIMSDEWRICIHSALYGALALGSRMDYGLKRGTLPQKGDVAMASVTKIRNAFVDVQFQMHGSLHSGQLHISEFGKKHKTYIKKLSDYTNIGDSIRVVLDDYNDKYESWKLRIAEDINFDNN